MMTSVGRQDDEQKATTRGIMSRDTKSQENPYTASQDVSIVFVRKKDFLVTEKQQETGN